MAAAEATPPPTGPRHTDPDTGTGTDPDADTGTGTGTDPDTDTDAGTDAVAAGSPVDVAGAVDAAASPVDPGRPAPGGHRPRPVFLLVGVVLAAALGIGLFTGIGTGGSTGRPRAGGPVPTFSLPRVGGGPAVGVPADGGGNGRPAVLMFFASWCGPCQKEIPAVAATYRHQHAAHSPLAKVALVGIVGNDPTATAVRFLRRSGVTFPSGADRGFTVTEGLFYFTDLPESVFVNGDGTIAAVHYGPITTADLVRWEHRLLEGG